MKYFRYIILLFFYTFSVYAVYAQSDKPVLLLWKPEGVVIELKDDLKHPAFSWPLSLLQYELDFGPNGILQNELNLRDELSGKNIPFQLNSVIGNNGRIQKGTLVFSSDLPSGAVKLFRLSPSKTKQVVAGSAIVKVTQTNDVYLIENGKIKIEIAVPKAGKIAAPIKRYGNADRWLGYGEMPAGLSLVKSTVTALSAGPVEATYKIHYEFSGNKQYVVSIKINAGMEFVELEEEMIGFTLKDNALWHMVWNGLSLDHRYISTRADLIDRKQKGYDNIAWEPMEGFALNPSADRHPLTNFDQQNLNIGIKDTGEIESIKNVENVENGKLPFRIAPYDNWMSWWRLPTAAFWSEQDNITVGLFIKDTEKWNDGLYALWGSKENLNICFHWNNKILDYTFPLVAGTRSTALAAYAHEKDKDLINKSNIPLAYIDELRRWYGWIPLNKVKSWILNYDTPETGYPRYFKAENATPALTLPTLENSLSNALKSIGTGSERINGPNPVGSRVYYDLIIPAFDLNASKMSPEQYRRLRAWYLFVAYLYKDEALMPIRTMLSGHPNFLSDIKGVTGLSAFLFPKHPEAQQMADHFEKVVHLNFNYHIRPEVPAWESRGGRWTENLATYTWAALTPAIRTDFLLHHNFDGKNRILQPGVSMYGNWLLNAITAPLDMLNKRRVYPPQGAHAHAYEGGPPNALRLLGQELMYYDPLLSENLFWFTKAEDSPFESTNEKNKAWGNMLHGEFENNTGTNPHLKSSKYTGYGFILRSGFGTKDEMYVNLQQIDEGPNYRWGRAAMGGNGVVYYYAQGKRYSHNGTEDVGDGPFGDTERISNFGIKKLGGYRAMGPYRSVGPNDLTEPLYDFGFAQFASIKGNKDISKDYRSRSVLQSSGDYIAVFDDVSDDKTEGRFSWFVGTEDDFPFIQQVRPGALPVDADIKPSKSNYHKDPDVMLTKGRYYDGKGSFLTIVSHKPEIKVTKTDFGCIVQKSNNLKDLIFRDGKILFYQQNGIGFKGTAGIVQQGPSGYTAALFSGSMIEVPGLKIELSNTGSAISLETLAFGFNGTFQSRQEQTITFTTTKPALDFYLDGLIKTGTSNAPGTIKLTLPAGKHNWQWISSKPKPEATEITATVIKSQGVILSWKAVAAAISYQVQLSKDGGLTWELIKDKVKENTTTLSALENGLKIHLRVIAIGMDTNSEPSNEYPVYVTDKIPHAPEGLVLDMNTEKIKINWGAVLGTERYQLYRRQKDLKDKTAFEKIYTGINNFYLDVKPSKGIIYEYVVTTLNNNGESTFSSISDTDPVSFLNWEPKGGEGFRRDTESHENGFLEFNPFKEDVMPVLTYPIIKKLTEHD